MTQDKKKTSRRKSARDNAGAREVAERVGVSVMTVSRALNGAEGVSEATRDLILKVAEDVGYAPNMAASMLRRQSSMTIAMLLDSSLGIRGEYHSDSLSGFEQVTAKAGYDLLLLVPKDEEGIPGLIKRLVSSVRCDAVVVRFDMLNPEDMALMRELDVPLVLASGAPREISDGTLRFSSASFDNRGGIARAVRHLKTLGHRRIAYLGGTRGWLDAQEREEGFHQEMERQGLEINREWIKACRFDEGVTTGAEGLDAVLSAAVPGPTAVICAADKIAAGAVQCARKWGLSVPEQLSVIGFDDDSWGEFAYPPLTTVRQDGFEYGRCLGKLILEELNNRNAPGRHVLLDTPLIVRGSTAPPVIQEQVNGRGGTRSQ